MLRSFLFGRRKKCDKNQGRKKSRIEPENSLSSKSSEVFEVDKSEIIEGDGNSNSLYDCVLNDLTDEALQFLESGAAVNVQSLYGNTVLHLACQRLNEKVMDKILEKDVDVNAKDKNGNTALHYLTKTDLLRDPYGSLNNNHVRLKLRNAAEKLLSNGAVVNLCNKIGQTPLHCASEKLNEEIVRILLEHRADPDVRDRNGNAALHLVIKQPFNSFADSDEIVRLLLENGANVHLKDGDGLTAIHYVVNTDDVMLRTIFIELLIWGGSLFTLDKNGECLINKIVFPEQPVLYKQLQKPLVEYIIALQCADLDCSEYAIVESTLQFEYYFPPSVAKRQIERIKAITCCIGSSYSLYDVFNRLKYRDPIFVNHSCLERLVRKVSFRLDFLDYGSLLKAKFVSAQKRYKMMGEVHDRFTDQLPNEVVWKILTFLEDEDLEQLSIAVIG